MPQDRDNQADKRPRTRGRGRRETTPVVRVDIYAASAEGGAAVTREPSAKVVATQPAPATRPDPGLERRSAEIERQSVALEARATSLEARAAALDDEARHLEDERER